MAMQRRSVEERLESLISFMECGGVITTMFGDTKWYFSSDGDGGPVRHWSVSEHYCGPSQDPGEPAKSALKHQLKTRREIELLTDTRVGAEK